LCYFEYFEILIATKGPARPSYYVPARLRGPDRRLKGPARPAVVPGRRRPVVPGRRRPVVPGRRRSVVPGRRCTVPAFLI